MPAARLSMHEALIYTMVVMSAADSDMTDAELTTIRDIVVTLPIFQDFDSSELAQCSNDCIEMLAGEEGLDDVLNSIYHALPETLRETAYALAIEIAAVDFSAVIVIAVLQIAAHNG